MTFCRPIVFSAHGLGTVGSGDQDQPWNYLQVFVGAGPSSTEPPTPTQGAFRWVSWAALMGGQVGFPTETFGSSSKCTPEATDTSHSEC